MERAGEPRDGTMGSKESHDTDGDHDGGGQRALGDNCTVLLAWTVSPLGTQGFFQLQRQTPNMTAASQPAPETRQQTHGGIKPHKLLCHYFILDTTKYFFHFKLITSPHRSLELLSLGRKSKRVMFTGQNKGKAPTC